MAAITVEVFLSLTLLLCKVVLCLNECRPKDCIDLKCFRVSIGHDGPHTVYPGITGLSTLKVSCDQTVAGGGWMVWMHRSAEINDTNFNVSFNRYKTEFGRHGGRDTEYYMGNENVHLLTKNRDVEVLVQGFSYLGGNCTIGAKYVRLLEATQKYKLQFGSEINIFQARAGTLSAHNNRIFGRGVDQCKHRTTMWWYASCSSFFLFGVHANLTAGHTSMFVSGCAAALNGDNSLTRAKMLLRKYNDTRQCNNPCKNGATCLHDEKRFTFSCHCAPGFSGSTCATSATVPETTRKFPITLLISLLLLLLLLIGSAVLVLFKKKQREKEEELEKEKQRLLQKEAEEQEEGFFGFFGF